MPVDEQPTADETVEPPLPPLPTKIRFEARYRSPPKARQEVSLRVFVALILFVCLCGYKGLAMIGEFLTITQKALEARARAHPAPGPTPEVEFFLETGKK